MDFADQLVASAKKAAVRQVSDGELEEEDEFKEEMLGGISINTTTQVTNTTTTSTPTNTTTPMDSLSFIMEICGVLKKLKRTGWIKHKIPLPESDSDHMHRCAMCAMLVSQPPDPRDNYTTFETRQYHPSRVDTTRLLRMAVTHDLCEALAGDITPLCDPTLVKTKHAKEEQAMRAIQKVVGGPLGEELYGLWKEYEDLKTVEAIYCKDIDKFEMVVQAFEYEQDHLLSQSEAAKKQASGTLLIQEEDASDTVTQEEAATKKAEAILAGLGLGDELVNRNLTKSKSKHSDIRAEVSTEPLRGFFSSTNNSIKTPLFRRLDKELRERRETFLNEMGWDVTQEERQKPLPNDYTKSLPKNTMSFYL